MSGTERSKDKVKKALKKKVLDSGDDTKSVKSTLKKKVKEKVDKSGTDDETKSEKKTVKKKLNTSTASKDKEPKEPKETKDEIKVVEEQNLDETDTLTQRQHANAQEIQDEFYNDTLETLVSDKSSANYCKIVSLEEAFRVRSSWVSNTVRTSLVSKRDGLVSQLKKVDERIEEVKSNRAAIEREVKKEYNLMIEKLKNQEGTKIAVLVHEMNELQKDIDRIDWVAGHSGELIQANRVRDFLAGFKDVQQTIEYTVTKPYKDSVDVQADDFVNEVEERNLLLQDYGALQNELSLKDDVIFKLIEEHNDNVSRMFEEVKNSSEQEIAHWMDLCDNYKHELNQHLKLREGLRDYVDILKEKHKLDNNLNRISEPKDREGKTELKYNYDKSRSFKMDVRDAISTMENILELTKVNAELYETYNVNNKQVNRILRRLRLYYADGRLGDKLAFADYEDCGYLTRELASKLLSKEFRECAVDNEVDNIVDFFTDVKGFDYKLFIHKFYQDQTDADVEKEAEQRDQDQDAKGHHRLKHLTSTQQPDTTRSERDKEEFQRYTKILNQFAQSKKILDPLIKSEVDKYKSLQAEYKLEVNKEKESGKEHVDHKGQGKGTAQEDKHVETEDEIRMNKKRSIIKLNATNYIKSDN